MKKKALTAILKLCVIAVCLSVLLRKLDLAQIRHNLAHVHWLYLLPALVMILFEPVVMAFKWNLLLRHKGIRAGLPNVIRLLFMSNFISIIFPTALGADALRVYFLKRQKHSLAHATASLLADRMIALAALSLLSLVGIAAAWPLVSDRHVIWIVVTTGVVGLAAIGAVVSDTAFHLGQRIRRRLDAAGSAPSGPMRQIQRIAGVVEEVHASTRSYAAAPRLLAGVFLLTVGVQVLRTFQIHFLFRAVGAPVPVFQEFAFVPMIILVTLLPISYWGFGVKEGAFAFFFSSVGVAATVSVSVSLITYPLIAIGLLPGAVFLALRGEDADAEASAPPGAAGPAAGCESP